MTDLIPLSRHFQAIPKDTNSSEFESIGLFSKPLEWSALLNSYRVVVLADAGSGKTVEMESQAQRLREKGSQAFFLRIEEISADFTQSFGVGTDADFSEWLNGAEDAWFFLDSVDEARLESPKAFENAIRQFASKIKEATHRAHIYISSRPYAWRPKSDPDMVKRHLHLEKKNQTPNKETDDSAETSANQNDSATQRTNEDELTIYWLCPLSKDDIRFFLAKRGVTDIENMLQAIERADLWSMAERPFDLDDLISTWREGNPFTNRLGVLRKGIQRRLREIDQNRDEKQFLRYEKALSGAQQISAAVVLTGQVGIQVPDGLHNQIGLNAESVLGQEWSSTEIKDLLQRGVFNDAIHGAVRIRHREVRDLLAAEWFNELLCRTDRSARRKVEALIFTNQYGQDVIRPRMRTILPWLILLDEPIRKKVLSIEPEISVEGGDISELPLKERQTILHDIVQRIATQEDGRSGRDNSAIARIAKTDLENDALRLIELYAANDDAIFFLGRFVWQGKLAACLPKLEEISCDKNRGIYARLASVRAVATIGSESQRETIWENLVATPEKFQRRLLNELIEATNPTAKSVDLLLLSLRKLEPYERFKADGLNHSLHEFIEKFQIQPSSNDEALLLALINGINQILDAEPYIERGECHVSREHIWLMPIALHAAEALINSHSSLCFQPAIISVLLKTPAVQFWAPHEVEEHKTKLSIAVPSWPEFNDTLYWASIQERRTFNLLKDEQLTDDRSVSWRGHFWQLNLDALPRVLRWIGDKENLDDKLIALNRAFQLYRDHECSKEILAELRKAIGTHPELSQRLSTLLHPPKSPDTEKWRRENAQHQRRQREREIRDTKQREDWVAALKKNPDRLHIKSSHALGAITKDQYCLMQILRGEELHQSRTTGANWKNLIPEFGETVSRAYRDAAVAHWRNYRPALGSEGANKSSIPYSLIFGLVGLAIEAAETPNFAQTLTSDEAAHALRYVVWEINGFPSWFETVYRAHSDIGLQIIFGELAWELTTATEATSLHYVLHDLAYKAPWLHTQIAPHLRAWLENHSIANADNFKYALRILQSSASSPDELATFAKLKLEQSTPITQRPSFYAIWVDTNPTEAIAALKNELLKIADGMEASQFAQRFIVALMGGRSSSGSRFELFKNPEQLYDLFLLMHQYIRSAEDIDRANGGVYSPELRDDAQDARNRLLQLLCEIPGKSSYVALHKLATTHPNQNSRNWMVQLAQNRAVQDADLSPWVSTQVMEFKRDIEITPNTHRNLFDLGVSRLIDFKEWLEHGNDSLATTYLRVQDEIEMRNVVANWLNEHADSKYSCAQEHELANGQRFDICLLNQQVQTPVPIELKLLDKQWSGPDLCERLKNQLAGAYLREANGGCGVFLLMGGIEASKKRWGINGRLVTIDELALALESYWQSISAEYPNVETIEIIVIDLTKRSSQ